MRMPDLTPRLNAASVAFRVADILPVLVRAEGVRRLLLLRVVLRFLETVL